MNDYDIQIHLDVRAIVVGGFVYSIDVLANGLSTNGKSVCISEGELRVDGTRACVFKVTHIPDGKGGFKEAKKFPSLTELGPARPKR